VEEEEVEVEEGEGKKEVMTYLRRCLL